MNFEVMVVSDKSVRVSWETPITTDYTVHGYAVFYSLVEHMTDENGLVDIIGNANSVTVKNLTSDMEYQFQVAVLADVDGHVVMGERSTRTLINISVGDQVSVGDQAVAMSVGNQAVNISSIGQYLPVFVGGGVTLIVVAPIAIALVFCLRR